MKLRDLLAPQTSPFRPYRREIVDQLTPVLQPGDILVRDGQHYCAGFIPFSRFVEWLTNSPYSHASLVYENDNEPLIADVSDTGMRRQFFLDWIDDVYGHDFLVLRYNGPMPLCAWKACQKAKKFVYQDPVYNVNLDMTDTDTLYCVQFIYECYNWAGAELAPAMSLKNFPNWRKWCTVANKLVGYSEHQLIYFVGNYKIGMLSSKELSVVCAVNWRELKKGRKIRIHYGNHKNTKSIFDDYLVPTF